MIKDQLNRILLAEDDYNLGRLFQMELEEEGYRVDRARDGIEAVSCFLGNLNGYLVVLLDMGMPELDGLGVLKIIRKLDTQIPIITFSSVMGEEEQALCFEAGASWCLSKPFKLLELKSAIDQLTPSLGSNRYKGQAPDDI